MSKKVIIILMTLLTSSLLGGIHPIFAEEVDDNQVTAENLLSMLSDSEAEVTSLFGNIIDEGGEVPEDAAEALLEAQELHAEAQGLYDEGSYEECVEKATDALNEYGKALEEAHEALEEAQEETEEETEDEAEEVTEEETEEQSAEEKAAKMIGLLSNVDKFIARIGVLRGIADELELDEGAIEYQLLDEAEAILENIKLNFDDLDESDIVLGEAVRLIGKATGMLKSQGQPMKAQKFEQFMLHTMNRVEQLNNKMAKIMAKIGSPEENIVMVQSQYGEIYNQLEGIDTKEDLKEAINQLKVLVRETRRVGKGGDDGEELFSEEAIGSVNDQMDVESQLEAYRELAEMMAEDDPLKAEVIGLIVQVDALLDEAETAISEDNEELADQKVEEAKEILETIEDLLGLDEGHGKGVKPEKVTENQGKSNGHNKDSELTEETTEEPEDPEEPEEPETTTN
jgi:hypothetical protein